jgi:superfamily II RNA helicase
MDHPLHRLLPKGDHVTNDELLDRFLEFVRERGLELYPAQEEAILALFDEQNVILGTPTGSGKSLVATALHFKALAQGRRSIYTCPIKALVNEKFLALCRDFGPDQVGMSTGDATVNREAPILCCTAEILANIAMREGPRADVCDVIMDEFHYYSDRERGVAWQVPLLTLPQTRFLLMSATLGDTAFFEKELTRLNGKPTVAVQSQTRPVPLAYQYSETPLDKELEELVQEGKAPIYIVHFTQMDSAESAQNLLSLNFCTREEKAAIASELEGFKFSSPYGPDIRKFLKHGVGLHHAGLLPKYRVLVEQLARKGLLKVICGTDTLGVGINVPLRTVLFTRLCKYDGQKTAILTARDFHQISGRAGRKGFDDKGWVVVQAPEHVIENVQMEQKCAGDAKKLRKFVKHKPPEKGFVAWNKDTFKKLVTSKPEQLVSRFQVTHGMLLNVLSREGDGCRALRELIRDCHDSPNAKKAHLKRAWQLFRSLLDRRIIEFTPPSATGSYLRVNVALQDDFSLDQTLSLYLLDTLQLIDPATPNYALDLLTVVESIQENPDIILRKQLDKVKDEKMAEMKAQGLDYDKRMAELELLEYPKPLREFIYSTFNAFSDKHPWVGEENIRPKSIAREMFENFMSFADYIRAYELQRAEGVLLRYLSSVYKTLSQNVPDGRKNDTILEMETYFGTMIRAVDSSLLDEWEKMRDPNHVAREDSAELKPGGDQPEDITRNRKAFGALVRTEVFRVLRALAYDDYEAAIELLDVPQDETDTPWSPESFEARLNAYYEEHKQILLNPEARNIRHTYFKISDDNAHLNVQQIIVDPEALNDWILDFNVDLSRSRELKKPGLQLKHMGPVSR